MTKRRETKANLIAADSSLGVHEASCSVKGLVTVRKTSGSANNGSLKIM